MAVATVSQGDIVEHRHIDLGPMYVERVDATTATATCTFGAGVQGDFALANLEPRVTPPGYEHWVG